MSCKQSEWSTCPQDILANCVASQADARDGAAAACVCKAWRQAYVLSSCSVELDCASLRSWPVPEYLSQFEYVVSVTMRGSAEWAIQNWLIKDQQLTVPAYRAAQRQRALISSIPKGCQELILEAFCRDSQTLPRPAFNSPNFIFAHLTRLRCLTIQEVPVLFPLAALQSLQTLEALALRGKVVAGMGTQTLRFEGGLEHLPCSVTKLQLHYCDPTDMDELMHLVSLQDLEISCGECEFGRLSGKPPLLTRLSLNRATELTGIFFDYLSRLSTLQVLDLFQFRTLGDTQAMGTLLSALPNLQELDINGCPNLVLSRDCCKGLNLALLSFHYDQLMDPVESYFQHLKQEEQHDTKTCATPVLRMESELVVTCPNTPWLEFIPFAALTHLHVRQASHFPWFYSKPNASGLQCLTVLDITFDMIINREPIKLDSKCLLHELYLHGGSFVCYDLAEVTSMVRLSITHRDRVKPKLTLPPHLTWLCLHNTLAASTDPSLTRLEDLSSLKLGGRVVGADVSRKLPSLPPSLVSLDLWDGLITDLQELTRLTNLKRLIKPEAPDQQQMSVIRRLRQLRRLEVTKRQGGCCSCLSTGDQHATSCALCAFCLR